MEATVVSTKGQIVIPKRIRTVFHIKKGTQVRFEARNGEIVLKPLTPDYFDKIAGVLGTGGKVLKTLLQEKKKEREL